MIRPATPDDEMFVVSGWSASYRMSRDIAFLQMADYADHMHAIVRSVIARRGTSVLVDESEVLRGFLAYSPPSYVLYCYVAQPFRGYGIARDLFAAAGIDPNGRYSYAARNKTTWQLTLARKMPLAVYDPMRIRFTEEQP